MRPALRCGQADAGHALTLPLDLLQLSPTASRRPHRYERPVSHQLDALLGDPDEVRARISKTIPLRRYGEPAEFGQAAAFVLSPAASYITGAMIPIDGGAIRSI